MKSALLITPWIYDFAAYDLWSKPLGLLYIGALLRNHGFNVSLVNCLDRYNPDLLRFQGIENPKSTEYDCGKFYKEIIEKPKILEHVPRRYGRYGVTLDIFRRTLARLEKPSLILVTSGMTYWYPGVFDAIRELRAFFPNVPIILGGTYATLCYDHAVKLSGADLVIKGEGESQIAELIGFDAPTDIDDYPYPAYDLLTSKNSLAILTSRGCPMGCSYCASKLIFTRFRQRNPTKVVDEIEFYIRTFGTKNFAIYDDALLVNRDKHIMVILDEIIRRKLKAFFHTPNGLHASMINKELAKMMFKAGFKTIRLGFETSNDERQRRMGYKVNSDTLRSAIESLKEAGYKPRDIGVYVLIGLPGQPLQEMLDSVEYVHKCRVMVKLAVYSPIPGTPEWKLSVERREIEPDSDPLLHNDSIYPIRSEGITYNDIQEVKALALKLNNQLPN